MKGKVNNVLELFSNMFEYFNLLDESEYRYSLNDVLFLPRIDCSEEKQKIYKKMSIAFIALIISLYKEECVGKTEDKKLYLKVNDKYLEKIFKDIIIDDENSLKRIGELSFNRKVEVFEKIRNKIAHGDFELDEETITIENDGLKGSIKIDVLWDFVHDLNKHYSSKLCEDFNRSFFLSSYDKKVCNLNDIKNFCRQAYFVEIVDRPVFPYVRTGDYTSYVDKIKEQIVQIVIKYGKSSSLAVNSFLKKEKQNMEKYHVNIDFRLTSIDKTDKYDEILNTLFKHKNEIIKNMSSEEQRGFITGIMANYLTQFDWKINTAISLQNNLYSLLRYSEDSYLRTENGALYFYDMKISALFGMFYLLYQYPLDRVYTSGIFTSLGEVLDGTCLDFSLLDLDIFDDSDMTIEFNCNSFEEKALSIERDYLKAERSYLMSIDNLRNYIVKKKSAVELETLEKLQLFSTCAEEIRDANYHLSRSAQEFMNKRKDKYVRNLNIIEHIRNSFAHGNVKVLDNLDVDFFYDRLIEMQDIYYGKVTYKKVIKVKDFMKLFSSDNLDVLMKFLMSLQKNSSCTLDDVKKLEKK